MVFIVHTYIIEINADSAIEISAYKIDDKIGVWARQWWHVPFIPAGVRGRWITVILRQPSLYSKVQDNHGYHPVWKTKKKNKENIRARFGFCI